MDTLSIAHRTEVWLKSNWHVDVPFSWLEACVAWIEGESRSTSLSQVQVNKQVLEQWLLTDLRDLSHPVLPEHASEAVKTELSGFYCVQMDSVVDISQPAYSQLQQWRGKDVSNDTVTAVTQATQRPWESKPTRMLLLQLTDGVQSLEGMEYLPIPALNVNLQPGTKILLQGTIVCRLGMLLLKPENVKVIGGEVEDLLEQNSQGRILCRLLRLPEEVPQENRVQRDQPPRHEEALTDEELLASLEADDQLMNVEATAESGYVTRSEVSSGTDHSCSLRNRNSQLGLSSVSSTLLEQLPDHPDVELVDEDFDVPFEDQDSASFSQHNISHSVQQASVNSGSTTLLNAKIESSSIRQVSVSGAVPSVPEVQTSTRCLISESVRPKTEHQLFGTAQRGALVVPVVGVSLDSPPFTYLSILQAEKSAGIKVVRVKAFIMTLLGSLLSSSGKWQVKVTISDGSGYLDADLSDGVLVSLIGLSVAESRAFKKDPEQRKKLSAALQNCQNELIDMCCLMTIEYDSVSLKAVVLAVNQLSGEDCRALENRVRQRLR